MKGILLGQFLYTKFNDYVLKITRDKLVHRLVADGERCSRGGRRGPVLGRRPAAAARPPAERSVLLRPPSPAAAAPTPGVAWAAALRQQVSWAPPTHWELNQHWSRRLVGRLRWVGIYLSVTEVVTFDHAVLETYVCQ